MTDAARRAVLEHFRWQGGHADVWQVFADAEALQRVVDGLVAPWLQAGITRVVGVESRGFLLGGACATALGAGFVAVRKDGGPLPGPKVWAQAEEDYRGQRHRLRMQRVLTSRDRVLLVDDWAERGSQARAVRELVEACDAGFSGVSLVVDQLDETARSALQRVTSLVRADELGPSGGSR